jgi:hypothetical protein
MALLLLSANSHLLAVDDPINRNDARALWKRCVHLLANLAKIYICLEGNRNLVGETFTCSNHAGSVCITVLVSTSRHSEVHAVYQLALGCAYGCKAEKACRKSDQAPETRGLQD